MCKKLGLKNCFLIVRFKTTFQIILWPRIKIRMKAQFYLLILRGVKKMTITSLKVSFLKVLKLKVKIDTYLLPFKKDISYDSHFVATLAISIDTDCWSPIERYLPNTHAHVCCMFQIMVENRPFILGTLVLVVFSALVFHILYPLVRVDSFAFYSYTFPQKIPK